MIWIGLTGGIACGKSTVARILRERGFAVVDADVLAREVVTPGSQAHVQITQLFGQDAVLESGELNRAKISSAVFSDRRKLEQLEAIIHPLVRARADLLKNELRAQGVAAAFYDVPLLFEKSMQSLFDKILVVTCTPQHQLKRLMERNQLNHADAQKRIAAQLPLLEKEAGAHHVIRNDGSAIELKMAVDAALKNLLLPK